MMFIDEILKYARAQGFAACYGNAAQINDYLTDVDFSSAKDGICVYCYLITDVEVINDRESANIAVYFASLCDFDFNGEQILPLQERLKAESKKMLHTLTECQPLRYTQAPRWQFGYNDFAENVCWCALRVRIESLVNDCYEFENICS